MGSNFYRCCICHYLVTDSFNSWHRLRTFGRIALCFQNNQYPSVWSFANYLDNRNPATGYWLLASGIGGYLVGRLRTKWESVPNDKIYFHDITHGFLVWAIAVALSSEPHCRRFAKPNRAIG